LQVFIWLLSGDQIKPGFLQVPSPVFLAFFTVCFVDMDALTVSLCDSLNQSAIQKRAQIPDRVHGLSVVFF